MEADVWINCPIAYEEVKEGMWLPWIYDNTHCPASTTISLDVHQGFNPIISV